LDEQDQYESVGLDDSIEDERDLDQIMADRRAAEVELHARDIRTGFTGGNRKLPQMLDHGNCLFYKSKINILNPTILRLP
jgi:DNA replication licensing factor MCM2